jgi:hypothetical protein
VRVYPGIQIQYDRQQTRAPKGFSSHVALPLDERALFGGAGLIFPPLLDRPKKL